MTTHLETLQALLRELFQLDLADLDFGLYRLFHLRQREIEEFITEQLPREVDAAFANVTAADLELARRKVQELAAQVRQHLGDEALLASGDVAADVRGTPLAQRYAEARRRLAAIEVSEAHKTEVYNHLVSFFGRYYEDGDFIPRRRYGAREAYAVPYNGEEVFFHWANREQHYVKTAERLRDYAFRAGNLFGEYRVRFVLTEASIPKDNTKGSTRFFFPRPDLVAYDADRRELTVPFEYRLPTPEEAERYGANSKAQEAILAEALPAILAAVPEENLRNLLGADQRTDEARRADEPEQPLLLRRLRHFCRRSTSDFFIHKDLRGFLTRELEFYIKDQVLHVLDLEADEVALDAKRRMLRAFRALAGRLIEFLAAIEDAEKALFEKRKFVLETDYLIPLQHVPRELWPEVVANAAQQEEWRAWYGLQAERNLLNPEGAIDEAFLAAHPTLPVHTRHYSRDFVRRLLEALPFDDLDEATDGLLVHGENYQALNLLLERYREQVKCIYIDPPYNTGNDGFLYRDDYRHSSWMVMVHNRVCLASRLVGREGFLFSSIDDGELDNLIKVLDTVFPQRIGIVSVQTNPKGRAQDKYLATSHDYLVAFAKSADARLHGIPKSEAQLRE
ncbi:MAG: site-specific DNA-methyltransferase, partial [Anaerolineae bacterium]|nr:site-specific DNA-methyltransferase [Anaerolineae bacterium]